jgi:cephalosporin-C deacetylase-like acetyl esterase
MPLNQRPRYCRIEMLALLILLSFAPATAQVIPDRDQRLSEIRHLDLTYNFSEPRSLDEWKARADFLRQQILVSAGLWPTPNKIPIKAQIFGKIDRGDHTIEKVYFESYPGFYVTGNLYRPKDRPGKLPAVLCPHGHWTYGRLENQALNSGPARAASFARQGYVAFIYDMVGYSDSAAISHRYAIGHREGAIDRETLWSVNLLGLQLWNSIRSIDFLTSLPDVDTERIACTGESGGGTQTFLLMAVDERIKVAAPVNMISFLMQGGSLCENAPNLRIDTNNVELGGLMAPRPMMMVSATGDWTKNTMTSEYPAIRKIYRLFGAEDKLTAVQMDAPHNYNQPSREAVYGWFAHWLLSRPETGPIKERSVAIPQLSELMVFSGRARPGNEVNEAQLSASLIEAAKKQYEASLPTDGAGLDRFRREYGISLKYSLMAEYPDPNQIIASQPRVASPEKAAQGIAREDLAISRAGRNDRVSITVWRRLTDKTARPMVLLLSPDTSSINHQNLAQTLAGNGYRVASIELFPGGRQVPSEFKFFTTYNRTDQANRVQDILTAISYLKKKSQGSAFYVVARGESGGLALLARGLAPQIDKMAIDVLQFNTQSDDDYLKLLPIPGLKRAGDFTTAVAIAPLTPLLIHNAGGRFHTEKIAEIYRRFGRAENFKAAANLLSEADVLAWLSSK